MTRAGMSDSEWRSVFTVVEEGLRAMDAAMAELSRVHDRLAWALATIRIEHAE